MQKTTVFNLIILDESGSMSSARKATVSGCNEVIDGAKSLAAAHADKENAFMSIYAFQSGSAVPSRYLCKNEPVKNARHITEKDYIPMGLTPLLDAVGATLVDLKAVASTHSDAYGVVTVITDGEENDSKEFTYAQVASLISELKEQGWTFNFIGANIDVEQASRKLNIDNAMAFTSDEVGTAAMFKEYNDRNMEFQSARMEMEAAIPHACEEDLRAVRRKLSGKFFSKGRK
ncbi:MAG: VWA domain-containing protein [Muribaculaceae bacterium]|nr:VWA domain-containing protein [Muribaculaceae bacterium]